MSDLLLLALMLTGITPQGWTLEAHTTEGLDAYVYTDGVDTVLAIAGTHTIADLVAIPIRRAFGYSDRYLEIAEAWDADIVVGHSAGGGVASWVGAELGIWSVTFNAAVPIAEALENDGTRQVNVIIDGDRWGDPENRRSGAALAGTYVTLTAPVGVPTHPMATIIEALAK